MHSSFKSPPFLDFLNHDSSECSGKRGGGGYDKGVEKVEQLSNNTFTLLESKRQVRETRMHHGKSIPYYKQTSLMMDDQYTKNSTTLNT